MFMERKVKILFLISISILGFYYFSEYGSTPTITENEENRLFVYDYVAKVTEIVSESYFKRLRETINLHDFPSGLNLSKEKSYPCLIPNEIKIKYPTRKYVDGTNFSMPFIFTNPRGRLGNMMGEYATQFALSKLYGVSTALTPGMQIGLIEIFPLLSMKLMPLDIDTDSFNCMPVLSEGLQNYNFAPSEIASAGLFGLDCFDIQGYPFDIRIFNGIRNQIVREFTFSDNIQQTVREFFSSVQESVSRMKKFQDFIPTYIGIHARRTDYMNHMALFGAEIPDDIYFIRAIQYYRMKFTMPIFIASSDDMDYITNVLQNEIGVFYAYGGTPEADMAILSSCNHSIFSVGSYGFWASFLAGGEVVYPDVPTLTRYTFTKYYYEDAQLSNFIPIPAHRTWPYIPSFIEYSHL